MSFEYHNKIEIKSSTKTYTFYNTMLATIYNKIANFQSFFDKIAFGIGFCEDFSNITTLSDYKFCSNLVTETIQNNLQNGDLFIKKITTIDTSNFTYNYLTEAGITSNLDDQTNPTIYNYFSFIDNDNPNGIEINIGDPLIISVQIYLNITNTSAGLLTAGNNQFISYLLGEGLSSNIYVARGDNLASNSLIDRTNSYIGEKYLCEINFNIDKGLNLSFTGDLSIGETNEIVFLIDENVFARINTKDLLSEYTTTETFTPKRHFVIDLGTGIDKINNVVNNSTSTEESDIYFVKYASDFASKITLPFNNLFDVNTSRFISRDGDKIFFLVNDYIYMFKNENYQIKQILSINPQIQNITKITSFDNFVFLFTAETPYIHAFLIENNTLVNCTLNLSSDFEFYSNLAGYTLTDIVQGKNGTFMLAFVVPINKTTAYTLYYNFDQSNNTFVFDSYISSSNWTMTYLLPFHKNNFSDAQFYFLQAGANSSSCRRIIHSIDKTINQAYSVVAYQFTYLTSSIEIKSRAALIRKNYSPNFWVYFYPQLYRVENNLFIDAQEYYMSTNLIYLIQKLSDGSFKAYNLVGYDTPQEFYNGIPSEIDQSKIQHIEILIDVVLFFMDDENEPIIAYSLNDDGLCIENVSSKDDTYSISLTKKDILGGTNEGVIATLAFNINI